MADEDEDCDSSAPALENSAEKFRKDENNSDLILVALHECLEAGKLNEVYNFLIKIANKDVLQFVGWEVIGIICKCLGKKKQNISDNQNEVMVQLLDTVAEMCSAKEVCIGILEQLSSADLAPVMFLRLLCPLQRAILRLEQKKSKFIKMAVPFLARFVRLLGIKPHDDGDKLPPMENALEEILCFLKPFVEGLSAAAQYPLASQVASREDKENEELQKQFLDCFVSLLEYPLSFHNIAKSHKKSSKEQNPDGSDTESEDHQVKEGKTDSQSQTSSFRPFAEQIMKFISDSRCLYVYLVEYWWIHSDLYRDEPYETTDQEDDDSADTEGNDPFPVRGLACFSYLLFVQKVGLDYFPAVFSNEYLLQINIKYILSFLERSEDDALSKGLALLTTLTERIEQGSLQSTILDQPEFICVAKRQRTVKFFPSFVAKFETQGKYKMLRYLLECTHHSSVAGLLINLVKEEVRDALDVTSPALDSPLINLIDRVLTLPRGLGKEVDVAEQIDRILAALNCLRFILLRDETDETGIWAQFSKTENEYLEPLRNVLKMARVNYQAELRHLHEDARKDKVQNAHKPELQVQTPDGRPIEHLTPSQQTQVLQSALNSLDVVESVLARVTEIADCRRM